MSFSGVAAFFIAVILIALIGLAGWIVFSHLRARRLGLPTPTFSSYNPFASGSSPSYAPRPAAGGIVGWVNDKIRSFRNRNNRSAGGAYEEPLNSVTRGSGRGANRGFGPLDPDDAWDARVGTEADAYGPGGYYEEQELGLHGGDTSYPGSGGIGATPAGPPPSYGDERGRARSREPEPYIGGSKAGLDRRYDEEMGEGASQAAAQNPFDDEAEPSNVSLRGVSPRPIDTSLGVTTKGHGKQDSVGDSPTERRSMFSENI